MQSFISISSQHESAQQVISDCIDQLKKAPLDANFGFIYATDSITSEFAELLKQCKQITAIEHWVGTIGLGVIAPNQEFYDLPAVSIMLAQFDENEFSMIPSINKLDEIASKLTWPHPFETNFGIIHGDPFNQEIQTLIENIQQKVENGFLVGGLTSSRDKHYQISDEVVSGGISGVLFSENIGVITNLSQGCSPVGQKHTINKALENAVFSLDHKPALDVLMHDMQLGNMQELQQRANEVFVGLCVKESDKSDYTVRNLVGADEEHSIFAINDYVNEGHQIVFCQRNEKTAIDDMHQMLENIASRLDKAPKGGLYVSCLGRGREQFGQQSEEIKMIHRVLGDFPLTGFFANGEIHHNKLYGYTGVLTLFT